ncbi:hypothetical protein Q3A66_10090 [Hymenobacter sp. BT770]|uniref:hypothetical protein n=1 Tax=Hymenobacter sp. BT770 TaxID=2886942 RepID=UPI001D12763C|nr:hypothetical protein [Hymenobacter sp. BT770]MCC3153109.1 hypothetical protein [Hymenobacter sp. BT770]MDO3415417.1 hypothetical protein [Hymenobacter sp. BT770]
MPTATLYRRLLPALLLAGLALSSCEHRKDCDPKPKGKCGTTAPSTTPPTGNS